MYIVGIWSSSWICKSHIIVRTLLWLGPLKFLNSELSTQNLQEFVKVQVSPPGTGALSSFSWVCSSALVSLNSVITAVFSVSSSHGFKKSCWFSVCSILCSLGRSGDFQALQVFPPQTFIPTLCWNFPSLPIKDSQYQIFRDQVRSVGTRKLQVNHLGEKSLVVIPEIKGVICCEVSEVYSSCMT